MSDVVRAVVLGIIEGLSEFLPISSTGHMILAMPMLGVDDAHPPWKAFLYFIQIGAILAVLVHFFRDLWRQVFRPPTSHWTQHLLVKLVVAVLPAVAIGLPLNDWVEKRLEKPVPVAAALVLGAVVMVLIERRFRRDGEQSTDRITLRQSFWIGLAQCVSIIPGTSRAMATILGGLIVGLPAATAVQFSFYLAIPTLLGAGLLKVAKHPEALDRDHLPIMLTGFAVSFAVAWIVVATFLRYVQRRSFTPFAVYRVLLGFAVLGWYLLATH